MCLRTVADYQKALQREKIFRSSGKSSGLSGGSLLSQTVITDGEWYHIGLVWDSPRGMLCVDGDP